jgi:hypothetical protein
VLMANTASGVGPHHLPYSRFALDGILGRDPESATAEDDDMEENSDSAKSKRRERQRPLRVLVSPAERQEIERRAASACLSRSAYLRAAGLSHPIRRLYDLAAVDRLAALGADLERLAGLLTLWLVERRGVGTAPVNVHGLLNETRALQQKLLELMSRV